MRISSAATVLDYRMIARAKLPGFLFHYIDGAAGTEISAGRNRRDVEAVALRQRVMVDVADIDLSIDLFGTRMEMPVGLGPVGLAGLFARRGECQATRAARAAAIPFCLSTLGICSLDEICRETGAPPPWFQLYMIRDRAFMRDLLQSVAQSGVEVLVLTVDVPVSGIRHRDRQSGLTGSLLGQAMQVAARPGWARDVYLNGRPLIFGSIAPALPKARSLGEFWGWLGQNFDASVTWADLEFVRQHWNGPIVVKGVMEAQDARAAVAAGADGLVVSNHGGRQLDGVRSTVSALPPVVDAVAGEIPVLVDGGIWSGIDVVRALGLGASACLLGRAWAYALAAGGQAAIETMLADLRKEIVNALAMTGCRSVAQAGRHIIDA